MGIWDLTLRLISPFPQGATAGLTLGSGGTSLVCVYGGVISGLNGLRVGVKRSKFGNHHIFTSGLLLKQPICSALCAPHPGVTVLLPALPTPWGAELATSSTDHHLGGFISLNLPWTLQHSNCTNTSPQKTHESPGGMDQEKVSLPGRCGYLFLNLGYHCGRGFARPRCWENRGTLHNCQPSSQ